MITCTCFDHVTCVNTVARASYYYNCSYGPNDFIKLFTNAATVPPATATTFVAADLIRVLILLGAEAIATVCLPVRSRRNRRSKPNIASYCIYNYFKAYFIR